MSAKNETLVLALSLLVTLGAVGAGFWWLTQRGSLLNPLSNPSPIVSSPPIATPTSLPSSSPIPTTPTTQGQLDRFADFQGVPSGLFSYGGSTTWAPIRRDVDPALQKVWNQFRLRYTDPISGAPGSSTGIQMLLEGQLVFAQSSRSIKDEEYNRAQQRGFSLKEIPVAIDGIAVVVNPSLDIPGLTIAQLKDIYTSQLTNWSQIGGPDLPITPYSRRLEDGGTIEFFSENILQKADFGSTVEFVLTTTQALRKLGNNPGGIYYASAPEAVPQCTVKPIPIGRKPGELVPPYKGPLIPASQCPAQQNQIDADALQSGQYPITRRLFVIIKQNGQVDQQAGEAYANLLLTTEGQALISKTGFIRIR